MSKKKQHQHISGLISETLRLLCKSGLTYKTNFSIDALIGITLDEDEVFLVNIKETVDEKGSDNDSHAESLSEESSLEEAVTQDADGSAKKARKRKRKRNSLSRSQDVASPLAKIQKPEDKGAVREVPGTPVSEGTVKETDKPTDRTQETTKTTTDDVDSTTEPSGPTNDTITSESQDKETQRTTGKPTVHKAISTPRASCETRLEAHAGPGATSSSGKSVPSTPKCFSSANPGASSSLLKELITKSVSAEQLAQRLGIQEKPMRTAAVPKVSWRADPRADRLRQAVEAVQLKNWTNAKASKEFGVTIGVLQGALTRSMLRDDYTEEELLCAATAVLNMEIGYARAENFYRISRNEIAAKVKRLSGKGILRRHDCDYSERAMVQALRNVLENDWSPEESSANMGVPLVALNFRLSNMRPVDYAYVFGEEQTYAQLRIGSSQEAYDQLVKPFLKQESTSADTKNEQSKASQKHPEPQVAEKTQTTPNEKQQPIKAIKEVVSLRKLPGHPPYHSAPRVTEITVNAVPLHQNVMIEFHPYEADEKYAEVVNEPDEPAAKSGQDKSSVYSLVEPVSPQLIKEELVSDNAHSEIHIAEPDGVV